jgi:hypothetical protein
MAAIPINTRPTCDEPASALPAAWLATLIVQGVSRKNPASAPKRQFAKQQCPAKPVSGFGQSARDVQHRDKKKHHDPE